ncbi:hypothetical protein DPMN_161031 [Dreissena polymorpha]|uniref:Uncharacterized protein n=1 Tax=Dreissena polymorpha TaxID=45954 RepID=A0A9D4EPN0_DREPO|nr:hypothetical protein DPMN_161031 [Dreissena polymorpha]
MGINWNARQDGTNRPRCLRGNSSAILVGYTRRLHVTKWHYTCTSGNTPPGKYVLKHTVTGLHTHILLGIHFQGNACHLHNHRQLTDSHTQSQTHLYLLGMAFQCIADGKTDV